MLRIFIHILLFISFSSSAAMQFEDSVAVGEVKVEHSENEKEKHDDCGDCHSDGCDDVTCCINLFGCSSLVINNGSSYEMRDLSKVYKSKNLTHIFNYRPPIIDPSFRPPKAS